MLARTVSPLASVLMTRTCSLRSLDEDVADWLELAEAAVDCAKAPRGVRTRAVAAMRAILAKKRLLRSHMTGSLPAGAEPVLGGSDAPSGNGGSRDGLKTRLATRH